MGKLFADRAIAKELGQQMYNQINSIWWLLFIDTDFVGCISAFPQKSYIFLDNAYIFPKYRRKGYFNKLLQVVLMYFSCELRLTSANSFVANIYKKFGFIEYSRTKNWIQLRKEREI